MEYGIQIVYMAKNRPIMQITWNDCGPRCSWRSHFTDRFPTVEISVQKRFNQQFVVVVRNRRIGFLSVDDNDYGEIEFYTSFRMHQALRVHHLNVGLVVVDGGRIELKPRIGGEVK